MIPQKTYRPNTQSDRRRYVDEVQLEPPIMFYMQNPSRSGMSLQDALHGRFMNLCDRDEHMFEQRGPSVSIRLMVCLEHVVATDSMRAHCVHSGRDTPPGASKYPPGTSGHRLNPSRGRSSQRTLRRQSNASFR